MGPEDSMRAETLKNQQDRLVELFISDDKDTHRQARECVVECDSEDDRRRLLRVM